MDGITEQSGHSFESKPDCFVGAGDISLLAIAMSASQALHALVGLKLTPLGLASGQDRFLIALEEQSSMTVSAVAQALGVRSSTVSKMTDRLEARGYAIRSRNDMDARKTTISLTDEGRSIIKKIRDVNSQTESELLADLSARDRQRMQDGITILNAVVGHRLQRLR